MSQLPLPLLAERRGGTGAFVIGTANHAAIEGLSRPQEWPFGTAVLVGPTRSGKTLLAARFEAAGLGEAIDDAQALAEEELFHRWNRAQADRRPLLLTAPVEGWRIALPDLASRIGAALHLSLEQPDEEMVTALVQAHAEARGLSVDPAVVQWLSLRVERSYQAIEAIVDTADRISLSRKAPLSLAVFREALEEIGGEWQPNLL